MPIIIEKLHLLICIFAAIVITVAFLIVKQGSPLFESALWVSGTIIVFYFVGCAVKDFVLNRIFPEWLETEETKKEEEEPEEEVVETNGTEIEEQQPVEAGELNILDDVLGE